MTDLPAVSAKDLSIYYRSANPMLRSIAVNGVSFELPQGEVLAVVGETGSGKSTLAQALALQADLPGDARPQIRGGSLSILGVPVRNLSRRKRSRLSLHLGYVPQEGGDSLAPDYTIAENIGQPITSRDPRFDKGQLLELVATLVDAMRLPLNTMDQYPYELSKGQRQRVAIARALILEPAVLIADNPTAGIDATVRRSVLEVIADLQRERLFSAVVVTSDLSEVRRIADRMVVMHGGSIVGIGPVDEVLRNPTHPYVRGLALALDEDQKSVV